MKYSIAQRWCLVTDAYVDFNVVLLIPPRGHNWHPDAIMQHHKGSISCCFPAQVKAADMRAESSLHSCAGARVLSDDRNLVLYALRQQSTSGPCKAPKPWAWNVVENAKYDAWSHLGEMSSMEAMRLYVRALEEDQVHDLS